MRFIRFYIVVFIVLLVSSCNKPKKEDNYYNDLYDKSASLVNGEKGNNTVVTHNGIWLGSHGYNNKSKRPIPKFLEQKISISSWYPLSLAEIVRRISSISSISMRLSRELVGSSGKELSSISMHTPNLGKSINRDIASQKLDNPMGMKVPIKFSGSIKKLLDHISEQFSIYWKVKDDESIIFYILETKVFMVNLPGAVETKTTVEGKLGGGGSSGGGSSSGSSSGGSGSAVTSMDIEKHGSFGQFVDAVKVLMSNHPGKKIKEIGGTNTIIVTDTPVVLEKITKFINDQNNLISQQVAIHVRVFEVSMKKGHDFNLAWGSLVGQLKGERLAELVSDKPVVPAYNSLIIDKEKSQLLLKILSTKANISTITTVSVVTLNNQPIPIQVVTDKTYVAESSIAEGQITSPQGGSQPLLEQTYGTLSPGLAMTTLPKILQHGKILLQTFLEVSELVDIRKVNNIELPELSRRTLTQRVIVKSEQTLVMSGFEKIKRREREQGSGSSKFWWFGGGTTKEQDKSVILLMMTPVLLSN